MAQPAPQPAMIPTEPALQPQIVAMPNNPYGPTPPKVRRIRYRHTMFKVGVGGLFLAVLLFIVGYSVPAWGNKAGLWMSCSYGYCGTNVGVGPDWLDAVRAMESLALICFLVCLVVELYQDVFLSPPPRDNRAVEILGIASGVLGLIGIAVYGGKLSGVFYSFETYSGHTHRMPYRIYFGWGLGLAAAGSIMIIICAILIAYSRSRHAGMTNQALALAGVVSPQSSSSGAIPMQPMMPPPQYPYMQPYPYVQPYPYMTPYSPPYGAYPAPATTAFMTPAPPLTVVPSPVAAAQGVPASQVPAFFVMVQGQMVPVYKEMPTTTTAGMTATAPPTTTDQTQVPDVTVDGQPNQK